MVHEQFSLSHKNPIISNHSVYGKELLPGLAYIDLIYQVFRKHGYSYKNLELRKLSIYKPLVVERNYSVNISINCDDKKEGQWLIRIEGKKEPFEAADQETTLYATAEMHMIKMVLFNEVLDINSIKESAEKMADMDELYKQFRQKELVHTGFMKAEGGIYKYDSDVLINILVGQEALKSAEEFMFHPVLIDGSGVAAKVLVEPFLGKEHPLFLPMYYESFYASELFTKRCVTRIKPSSMQKKNELLYMTIEFFNEYGNKIGELKNFANKLVRGTELFNNEINNNQQQDIGSSKAKKLADYGQVNKHGFTSGMHDVEDFLKQLLAERVNKPINQIDIKAGYYEMGLDSSGLLDVVRLIEEKIEVSLAPTLLFEYTSISELATYIQEHYASKFTKSGTVEYLQTDSLIDGRGEYLKESRQAFHVSASASNIENDIAIIGMSGRYPKARNIMELWDNLVNGKDCISEIPDSRWDWHRLEDVRSASGRGISKWGGFIDDVDCFDPRFFRISPKEAEIMDPQERLFLETCWEAIEDAGYTPKTLVKSSSRNKRRNVGVFVGVMHRDYTFIGAEAIFNGLTLPVQLNSGSIANRVSYFCDFNGPSISIDTLCSSSLTSTHLAIESLLRGESEIALAGGVNLSLHFSKYLTYGMANMHSSDGFCHTFGIEGDGYVSADGVGAVVLKPLDKAVQDKDHIYAVIKGSAINHGGTASGITVPNPVAQSEVITSCFDKTGINPRTVSYIEAHGTGTSLGDPIEIQGLMRAFSQYTSDTQYCSIGSIKSNIGHAESAAGVIGIQKAALQLYHKTLVPSLHSEELNPYINFEESPFYIQHKTEEWKQPVIVENDKTSTKYPRRAGVSSFGATGSNAHIILEEYIPEEAQCQSSLNNNIGKIPVIIPLSAKNPERLLVYAENLLEYLKKSFSNTNTKVCNVKTTVDTKEIEHRIQKMLSDIINVHENAIGMEEWNEYGVDPVQKELLRGKINEEFNIEIDTERIIETNSVASLVEWITNHSLNSLNNSDKVVSTEHELKPFYNENMYYKNIELADLAYTLQVGREAMEERVIFIVKDISELLEQLEGFIAEKDSFEKCYRGQVKRGEKVSFIFSEDEESKELINKWIINRRIEKLAELWVNGINIDWGLMYGDKKPNRISLPTYPFEKRRCWIEYKPDIRLNIGNDEVSGKDSNSIEAEDASIENQVIEIVCSVIGMTASELDINESLEQYGFDSIILMSLFQQLQSRIDPTVTLDKLQKAQTVQEIINALDREGINNQNQHIPQKASKIKSGTHDLGSGNTVDKGMSVFPELIQLNQSSNGRPVFWFHAGLGGVETYYGLAKTANRPFYGIQARGWRTERAPLRGIQAMAAYYVHIIRTVQLEGPYDLGGYSLGGDIAYEVTRQLQELGQVVNSVVMIDSLDSVSLKRTKSSEKTLILQAINTALISTLANEEDKFYKAVANGTIIKRDEVSLELENELYLKKLISLAKKRGLTKTKAQLEKTIKQIVEIQNAYELERFTVFPLPDPHDVSVYYFRNKSGMFYGELSPYFSAIPDSTKLIDGTKYWEEWEKYLPELKIIDVDSTNHMTLLSDPKVNKEIYNFCSSLYRTV